jgi:hypothetical protein
MDAHLTLAIQAEQNQVTALLRGWPPPCGATRLQLHRVGRTPATIPNRRMPDSAACSLIGRRKTSPMTLAARVERRPMAAILHERTDKPPTLPLGVPAPSGKSSL